jgi:O-antigen ligase
MFNFFLWIILLAPLPFGANRAWAWSLYTLFVALIGLMVCMMALSGRSPIRINTHLSKYLLFLVCIPITWSLLQQTHWAPEAWAHPFWQLASAQLPDGVEAYISLTPKETVTALMRLGGYLLVFLLSLHFNDSHERVALTFKSLAYAGLIYAVYGLIIYLGDYNTLLWFERWNGRDSLTSTFVNRNSYATYAGLTLLASFPLLFEKIQFSSRHGVKSYYGRQYFFENMIVRGWQPLLIIIIITTALFLTHSRGGFLSSVLAVFSFFTLLLLSRKIKNNRPVMLLLIMLAVVSWSVLQQSGDQLIARLDAMSPENEGRWLVYDILSKANAENKWLGVGYGSFEKSFRLYRDETILGFYDRAHNTYLENIFELGLLQALALFIAIFWLALICLRGVWRRRKDWIYPAIGFSATLLVGAHALVDFSLQIPAVAYTYALMMGAAVRGAYSSQTK